MKFLGNFKHFSLLSMLTYERKMVVGHIHYSKLEIMEIVIFENREISLKLLYTSK